MYNYNPYQQYNYTNNNYMNELQQMKEKIDRQMQQAQQQQQQIQQMQQPAIPQINQSFQLAPQTNNNNELEGRYAENIDEVKNTFVMKTGIFATKDYSIIWIKDVSGNIKTYKTEEVLEVDEKDVQIQELKKQLDEMKNMIKEKNEGVNL